MAEQTVRMVDSDGYEYIIGKETGITYDSTNPEWKASMLFSGEDAAVGIARRDEQGRLLLEVKVSEGIAAHPIKRGDTIYLDDAGMLSAGDSEEGQGG